MSASVPLPEVSQTSAPAAGVPASSRLDAIDAYRGLVMFLMMAEVLRFGRMAELHLDSSFWKLLAVHQDHVEWIGCVLHDMIQPSFSFLVGVALPFSLASRTAKGQSRAVMTAHALWRSLVLVLLGVFLRSVGRPQTYWTFEDTLSQIGLGYPFLFLLGWYSTRMQWAAFAAILVGYWGLFAAYPLPGPSFDYPAHGVPADWPHLLNGFAAHWNKNSNPAWAFDVWFLNLFPREKPFAYNGGGYATLSFIPTLATMILGLIAGGVLRSDRPRWSKTRWLAVAGVVALGLGWGLGELGLCPVVKRIWTPSWVLYSGGISLLFLAAFYLVLDVLGAKAWAFPLRVIGMNSIAAYCLSHLIEGFIVSGFRTHLGKDVFNLFGTNYAPFVQGVATLSVLWLILFWMYRRRLFLRV
jgi:heparan-alpha-glucosaminide N-acetyltransferase